MLNEILYIIYCIFVAAAVYGISNLIEWVVEGLRK